MLIPLKLPPGVVRPGTKYDAKGRWYDTQLVRWREGAMQPIGGWRALTDLDGEPVSVGEPVRGMIAWRANDATSELAMGTPSKLYQFALGVLSDITPTGFAPGGADASLGVGAYGYGPYGSGVYGTGDESQEVLTEANTWQLDTFGEDLVACAYSDGVLYHWDKSEGGQAVAITGAPTGCLGVVVTPERFLVALGADGDGRRVAWADQESLTTWTPAPDNQAGDFRLAGSGQIMAGRRSRSETLIWTDVDLWAMRYIGGPFVYSFQQVGSACGAASRHSMAVVDGRAFWMGHRGFFLYDGYVQRVRCDVADYVFGSMNRVQVSKVWCDVRSEYGEVTWYYPSDEATECDRYVTFNYAEGFWAIGKLERTAGVDRGPFQYPVMADASGNVYFHEVGDSYLDPSGAPLTPYAESGPVEIADGNAVMSVLEIIPDEKTLGEVELSLIAAFYPTGPETMHGPYTMTNPTPTRITGRQLRLRASQVSPGWRLGTPRIDVRPGGRR